ncbi:unnamed protein product [Mesocestoides corti]|uniref:GATA-type domain-containing protein n=1 Tax=Mesocestoides corti TaxID=53468 RepID=A0A0R3UEM4_MESCO|nr:unnamed protein product [Mesocestoides corti]
MQTPPNMAFRDKKPKQKQHTVLLNYFYATPDSLAGMDTQKPAEGKGGDSSLSSLCDDSFASISHSTVASHPPLALPQLLSCMFASADFQLSRDRPFNCSFGSRRLTLQPS